MLILFAETIRILEIVRRGTGSQQKSFYLVKTGTFYLVETSNLTLVEASGSIPEKTSDNFLIENFVKLFIVIVA